jgi:hypothetical protein
MVKSFHPEPKYGEGTHNDVLKRVTTPADIATVGAKAQSFRSEKPSNHKWYVGPPTDPEHGLQHTIWESTLPKRRQHQDPPTLAPCHPHGQKSQAITTDTPLAVETTVRSTFQGRRPSVRDLTPTSQQNTTMTHPTERRERTGLADRDSDSEAQRVGRTHKSNPQSPEGAAGGCQI